MEDATRHPFANHRASETTLNAEARPSGENVLETPPPEALLLSRETTDAVSLAVHRLAENVKKREPTLEEVVGEALRPMLKSWVDENLHDVVEGIVRPEIERAIRGR